MEHSDEFGDGPGGELRGTFAEHWRRYQAQVVELRANQQQWRSSWQHYRTTGSVWGIVLMKARAGVLDADWRSQLSPASHYAAGFPRPTDPALIDADALAIHEVATAPPSAWEPNAAAGDWRRALSAWQAAEQDLQRHQFRTKRWLRNLTIPESDQPPAAALDAVLEARALDAIEASYRAGLTAGGDTQDWRAWYRRRIIETWSAADDSAYGLYYSVERILARIDSGAPIVTGADTITIQEYLPEYWQPQPANLTG